MWMPVVIGSAPRESLAFLVDRDSFITRPWVCATISIVRSLKMVPVLNARLGTLKAPRHQLALT